MKTRVNSSAVEHLVYTEAVGGSIPSSPINKNKIVVEMKSFNQFYEQAGRLIPGGPYSSEKPAPSLAGNEPKESNTQSKKSPRMVPPKKEDKNNDSL